MKKALLTACLWVGATNVLAADYGIGVSAQSDDSWVYVPIDFNDSFRLEPSIRFTSSKTESVSNSSLTGSGTETTNKSKFHQREYALGAFGLTSLTDSVRLYYGLRAAYIDGENTLTTTSRTFTTSSRSSQDGYRLSPTLGFEYVINKHFSVGGEAEWFYLDVDGDSKSTSGSVIISGSTSRFEQKANGTDTHLIVRYRF